MNNLDDIISNTINNKSSIYKKYDPLEKTKNLLDILNKESDEFNSITNTNWNKLNNGYKLKLIYCCFRRSSFLLSLKLILLLSKFSIFSKDPSITL